ncbi:MAG: hypothetical protein WCJ84_04530 [Candidatus Peregrinibacteria bacterium]
MSKSFLFLFLGILLALPIGIFVGNQKIIDIASLAGVPNKTEQQAITPTASITHAEATVLMNRLNEYFAQETGKAGVPDDIFYEGVKKGIERYEEEKGSVSLPEVSPAPSPAESASPSPTNTPKPLSKAAQCKAKGGIWSEGENDHIGESCAIPATDTGKTCADSDECQGFCLPPDNKKHSPNEKMKGICSKWQDEMKGRSVPMLSTVENGKYNYIDAVM